MQETKVVLTVLGRKLHSYIAQGTCHAGQHKIVGVNIFLEQWNIPETANLRNM
jgi:hypothetical protein